MTARRQSLRRVFAWPLVIGLASIVGLVVALTGNGWRDAAAWAGVAMAVAPLPWARRARRS